MEGPAADCAPGRLYYGESLLACTLLHDTKINRYPPAAKREASIVTTMKSDARTDCLTVVGRFHDYSFGNVLEIAVDDRLHAPHRSSTTPNLLQAQAAGT